MSDTQLIPGDAVYIREQHRKGDRFKTNTVGRIEEIHEHTALVMVPQRKVSAILGYAVKIESTLHLSDLTLICHRQ